MTQAEDDPPFVVVRLRDGPGQFPLPRSLGRELMRRISNLEPDPPGDTVTRRIQAAADERTPFIVEHGDRALFLSALDAPPPIESEVLLELRTALQ